MSVIFAYEKANEKEQFKKEFLSLLRLLSTLHLFKVDLFLCTSLG